MLTLSLSSILSTVRVSRLLASSLLSALWLSLLAAPRWISTPASPAAWPGSTEMISRPLPVGLGCTLIGLPASSLTVTAARPLPVLGPGAGWLLLASALSLTSVEANLAPARTEY